VQRPVHVRSQEELGCYDFSSVQEMATTKYTDFQTVKHLLLEHCFKRVENLFEFANAAASHQELKELYSVEDMVRAMRIVGDACTQKPPYNFSDQVYEFMKSQVQQVGDKYPVDSERYVAYVKIVAHAFNFINRLYCKRYNLGTLHNIIETEMELGAPRAAACRRWRRVKHCKVFVKRKASIMAQVDKWIIDHELSQELADAKSRYPHYKNARLV